MISASGRSIAKLVLLSILPFLLSSQILAQSGGGVDAIGTGGRHAIQGRIYFPSGRRSDVRVKVRLENFNGSDLVVLSDANGSFAFRGLEPGSYTVVVDAGSDYQIAREPVYVETDGVNPRRGGMTLPPAARLYTVQINLQLKTDAAAKAAVIDAKLAALPDNVQAAYRKALQYIEAGETNKAIEQLKVAINLFPQFPVALNELGVQYLKVGQPDKAAEVLKKAVALAPQDFQPTLNYGIALLNQKKFPEAETQFRNSLKLNNSVPTAHMYLGIVLAVQRKLDEGQAELELAIKSNSTGIALAHRYLAGIFLERHEYEPAANELEKYLKLVPKAPDADILNRKVQELRNKK